MSAAPADFERLYRAEIDYVARTLRRLGASPADLEDLTHDVFVVAYRRRADRDAGRPVRPWLFGIAYRVLGNELQRARRRREVATDELEAADRRPGPAERASRSERREILLAALATLDLEQRAVVVLHDLEGINAPVIAELLEVPVNTVYSRLRRARQKLLEKTRALRGGKP